MNLQYHVKRQAEQIGPFSFEIECLENLDRTIDEIFAYLEKSGSSQTLEELCPYFGVIWPSARALSEVLAQLSDSEIRDRRVIEMGCGLAIPSMVAAHRGAQVLATDFHPDVPKFLNRNLALNQIQGVDYRCISWEKERPNLGRFSWVIGSDILYEQNYPKVVAQTIAALIEPLGRIVITDPGRPYLQGFVDEMKLQGFSCETRIITVLDTPVKKDIFVLEFHRGES